MTTDQEIADRLARAAGFVFEDGHWWHEGRAWCNSPFRPGDVNAVLATWPEGWRWERKSEGDCEWWAAFRVDWDGEEYPTIPDTDNIWHDLALLTAMVLEREAGR